MPKLKNYSPLKYAIYLVGVLLLLFIGSIAGFYYFKHVEKPAPPAPAAIAEKKDANIAFLNEVYGSIKEIIGTA